MTSKKRQYAKCSDCGWYIGKSLLDEENYDGVCPICESDFSDADPDAGK